MKVLGARRLAAAAAMVATALFGVTACGGAGAGSGSDADESDTIRVGVPRGFGFSNILWARDYQVDGYHFEYSYFPNYTDLLSALASGNVDIAEGGDVGAIQSNINTGGGVQAFAITDPAPQQQAILVKPDSGIDEVADLKGKRVTLSTATNYYPAFVTLLEESGLSIDDVEIVDSTSTDANQAYVQDQVDAFVATDPALAWVQEQTDSTVLSTFESVFDNFYPYFGSTEVLENKSDAVAAYTTAIADNIEWAIQNPEEYAQLLSPELGFTEESLITSIQRGATKLRPIDDAFLDGEQEWLKAYGEYDIVTDPEIDVREVFITDFNDDITPSGVAE